MLTFPRAVLVSILVSASAGCASMCDGSLDCDYHAFGGVRDRFDRVSGRVGSVFAPAAAMAPPVYREEPLPELPQQADGGSREADPGTGEVEDSGLTEELLNELNTLDELPEVQPGEADLDEA